MWRKKRPHHIDYYLDPPLKSEDFDLGMFLLNTIECIYWILIDIKHSLLFVYQNSKCQYFKMDVWISFFFFYSTVYKFEERSQVSRLTDSKKKGILMWMERRDTDVHLLYWYWYITFYTDKIDPDHLSNISYMFTNVFALMMYH